MMIKLNGNMFGRQDTALLAIMKMDYNDAVHNINKMLKIIAEVVDYCNGVTMTDRFYEIGNSLDRVKCIIAIEEEFEDLTIESDDGDNFETVGDLIGHAMGLLNRS